MRDEDKMEEVRDEDSSSSYSDSGVYSTVSSKSSGISSNQESEEGDPTDFDDEWVEKLLDEAFHSNNLNDWVDKLLEEAVNVQSNAAGCSNSIFRRSKRWKLKLAAVLETSAPVSGVADATASAAATDANKKKRPLSPEPMSTSLCFQKQKVLEEEPDTKRARLSEPEKSPNKRQTGADHSRSWSDTISDSDSDSDDDEWLEIVRENPLDVDTMKTVRKVDASIQATTGWVELSGVRLYKSSLYRRKASDKNQLREKQPLDSLTTLRLSIEMSIYYIQEAFALEVEKADATLFLSKLADALKFSKANDASIKKMVAQDDLDMHWNILLVLNTRIMSYVSKKLYLVRQKEMEKAKLGFDTYFMAKLGNKNDKSDRVITAQVYKNLEFYIKYADYSRKSDQYYILADDIVSKYPKVKQFYDNLEIQYREFLPIRPIDMFANYCLAATASLANTEKS